MYLKSFVSWFFMLEIVKHATVAAFCCASIFAASHLFFVWRKKRNDAHFIPTFFERPMSTIGVLVFISCFDVLDIQTFSIWLIFFYLLFLAFYTKYLTRWLDKMHDMSKCEMYNLGQNGIENEKK